MTKYAVLWSIRHRGCRTCLERLAAAGKEFVIKGFPLLATLKPHASDGSSGGGANDSVEVNKGCNPKRDMNPLAPVQVPSLENPKLSIENKIAVSPDLKLPDSPEIVVIGIHSSANVTLMSGWSRQQGRDWFGRRRRGWARPGSEGARPWLRSGDLRAGTERRDSSDSDHHSGSGIQ